MFDASGRIFYFKGVHVNQLANFYDGIPSIEAYFLIAVIYSYPLGYNMSSVEYATACINAVISNCISFQYCGLHLNFYVQCFPCI